MEHDAQCGYLNQVKQGNAQQHQHLTAQGPFLMLLETLVQRPCAEGEEYEHGGVGRQIPQQQQNTLQAM